MIDRCLFPGTFADILAHLWMNKVSRTQLLKERDFLAVRALDFLSVEQPESLLHLSAA